MRNFLLFLILFAVSIGMQAQDKEGIDQCQFAAIYDYSINTLDHEGKAVRDEMKLMVQVGRTMTKSMPLSEAVSTDTYKMDENYEKNKIVSVYNEAKMHMPTVWIGYPEGMTTVREYMCPYLFEGSEPTPNIAWTLLEDTMSIGGFLCLRATATFRGVDWQVWYTEEIPSSAGPWRLRGLPGLIVKAEGGAHTFCLAELRQEEAAITQPELNPDVERVKYDKYLKHKNKLYGNRLYPNNPIYHISKLTDYVKEVFVFGFGEERYSFANSMYPLLTKSHVYQPLELK